MQFFSKNSKNFQHSKSHQENTKEKKSSEISVFDELHTHLLPFAFGKKAVVDLFLLSVLCNGHILIEDLPGVGKTTLSKAFSALIGKKFSRIQGTSDLLPSDILGGEMLDTKTNAFSFQYGPIFSEVVLIDEINRMHPKTQSAFLEAMEEKSVSIFGKKHEIPAFHLILATQNPIEYAGTNPLPEAQRDRFFCRLSLGIPSDEILKEIFCATHENMDEKILALPALDLETEKKQRQDKMKEVQISSDILETLLQFFAWTRSDEVFRYGVSPRGMFVFVKALRAYAVLQNRNFVLPEDALFLLSPLLLHRLEFSQECSVSEGEKILKEKFLALM